MATIQCLPQNLSETYKRALYRIKNSQKVHIAAPIFRYVAVARRPLSADELREAIAVQRSAPTIDERRLVNDMSQLVSWCASLVIQDEEEQLIQFAHHSVKEFLLSGTVEVDLFPFCFQLTKANHELAGTCLTYLNLDAFRGQLATTFQLPVLTTPITPNSIVKSSFSVSECPTVHKSWLKIEKFLSSRATHNPDIWKQLYISRGNLDTALVRKLKACHKFLAYASEYWLFHTASLTRKDEDLWFLLSDLVLADNTVAARPWTSTQWAAGSDIVKDYIVQHNHWALAEILQTCGHSLTAEQRGSLILSAAHNETDSLFASTIYSSPYTPKALDAAIRKAKQAQLLGLVERLSLAKASAELFGYNESITILKQRIDVEGKLRNITSIGSDTINKKSVPDFGILIEKSFNVEELADDRYKTLRAVAASGTIGMLEILLDPSTGYISRDNPFVTAALHAAAQNGNLEFVTRLMSLGSASSLKMFRENVLYTAARCGHTKAVQTFLEASIGEPFIAYLYEAALRIGTRDGCLETVYEALARELISSLLKTARIRNQMDAAMDREEPGWFADW